MNDLIRSIKNSLRENRLLPFSVYSSLTEQRIFNVPIIKPMLIFVLDGEKRLGKDADITCAAGHFIFLSNSPTLDMRNIPSEREYFALLIEFEYQDFAVFNRRPKSTHKYFMGTMDESSQKLLQQFIDSSAFLPADLWRLRRVELLQYLDATGYNQVRAMVDSPGLSYKLHDLIRANMTDELGITEICAHLAMSESTLRRKLLAEGTSVQEIKDQTKLGYGLHLLQTSVSPIGEIAARCGYHSQSRFTERFKQRFGLTPSELRKTQLHDSGENLTDFE